MPNSLYGANKQGLIVFDGERSDDYGMVVSEAPSFERARRKQTIFSVPGRNGSVIFQEDAWEDVTRSYNVFISDKVNKTLVERVDAFEAMLNSKKDYLKLSDNFEPDTFRLAYYSGGDGFTNQLLAVGQATLNFTCRAERFLVSGETPVAVVDSDTLDNPTLYTAKPIIHIEGSGTVTVSIGGKTITADIVDYINIDCERMNAYRLATENMNDKVSGDFPLIAPGSNGIGITGAVTLCEITPRYFTI